MKSTEVTIIKNTGEKDAFDEEKLRNSLLKAGASSTSAETVVTQLKNSLYDGISTKSIYQKAHQLLKRKEAAKASRYKLKQAILELGPTGYPFELFVGEIYKAEGYQVRVGEIHQGKCVTHEVDVLAEKPNELLMLECKFHNRQGYKTDVKVPLYIDSRFRDLENIWKDDPNLHTKKHVGGVVTNARLTQDAITYGLCSGLKMISWDYPEHHSLKALIDRHKLYPITSLHHLTKHEKQLLVDEGIVITKTLCDNFEILDKLRINQSKLAKIEQEAKLTCEL